MGQNEERGEPWLVHQVELSLTVEGDLNPAIIHPQWLAREALLTNAEADAAQIQIAADDYSLFNTLDFTTEVSRESMSMTTRSEEFEPSLREIFSGTLRLLRHTPVHSLTISRFKYWRPNPTFRSEFENGPDWRAIFPMNHWEQLIHDVKPRGIAIEGTTPDKDRIPVTLAVEPGEGGLLDLVYVGCRYDWDLDENGGVEHLQEILENKWNQMRKHSQDVSSSVLKVLEPQKKAQ